MTDSLWSPQFWLNLTDGVVMTLWITVIASVCALIVGFLGAFAKTSSIPWLEKLTTLYVEVFRNTPLLIQMYLFYSGLPNIGIRLPAVACGIITLTLYTGAYLTEVFRSAFLAIPQEQMDAGKALGLNRFQTYRLVIMPQALRILLPPTGNLLISLAKNSSLVAFITVTDLFYYVYKGAVDEFRPFEFFVAGAVIYMTISLLISGVVGILGRISRPNIPTFTDGEVSPA